MLETLSCERLVRRCASAVGFTAGVPTGSGFAERLADTVNDAIAKVWGKARWPQLTVFERRWYRPPWEEGAAYARGQECRHGGRYWRALVDAPATEPGVGSVEWGAVDVATMAKFIALDQPWERHEIGLRGVDLAAFAFARDPRVCPEAAPLAGCAWMGDYPGGGATRVRLPPEAPESVVVAYHPQAPRISLEPWEAGRAYAYSERVYHGGECWRCLAGETREEPTAVCAFGPWERVRLPEFLVPCVRAYVAAAFMEDEQGRARAYGRADAELEALREAYCGGTSAHAEAAFGGYGEE